MIRRIVLLISLTASRVARTTSCPGAKRRRSTPQWLRSPQTGTQPVLCLSLKVFPIRAVPCRSFQPRSGFGITSRAHTTPGHPHVVKHLNRENWIDRKKVAPVCHGLIITASRRMPAFPPLRQPKNHLHPRLGFLLVTGTGMEVPPSFLNRSSFEPHGNLISRLHRLRP